MKDDGGAAFPSDASWVEKHNVGMSLRDYFSGQALKDCPVNRYEFEESAEWCYKMASAMLSERAKGE
jgi:hypothetical protein